MKIFLEKEIPQANELELKYNYLPKQDNNNNGLDNFCLNKTINISHSRSQSKETKSLEFSLSKARDIAVKNIDIS